MISSQRRWPLDHEAGQDLKYSQAKKKAQNVKQKDAIYFMQYI